MKPFLQFTLAMFCFFNFSFANAQDSDLSRDTIYYHGNENLSMYILSKDYHLLTQDDHLQSILKDFQSRLREIQESIPSTSAFIIRYKYKNQIDILKSDKIRSFSILAEKGLTENFQNQAIITHPYSGYQVDLAFNEIDKIIETDFTQILLEIIPELPRKDRRLRFLEFQNDPKSNEVMLTQNRVYLDMLSLQAGVGANVYRSKYLTDITGEIGLQLNHKGIMRNQFYVSNNLMFSFDAENAAVVNNFTNFGYRRNLSNDKDKPNWLGVEFGTLTKRSRDIFQSNTMRLGVNWQAGKHITVSPQLYFNGFFQQVSPGFRIGIGL